MLTDKQINELLESLTLDEKIGQMLCYDIHLDDTDLEKAKKFVKEAHVGSFFVDDVATKRTDELLKILNENSKIPGMIAADVENGPGCVIPGETGFPHPMAWGACGDADLIRRAHEATAIRCRQLGIHWSFSPVVDINYNSDNPVVNIRGISDKPEIVAKFATAAAKGLQKNGFMAAGCKHFPGDGLDDRNQHFCTTVNSMSKEEWMNTYGYVYKQMFEAGVFSVMVAHIALPAYDEIMNEWVGYPPASISYNLQTKLLKEELGFKGCIVSDAMSMTGACACMEEEKLAVEFIKAGGDIVLFPLFKDFERIKNAVLSGEIPIERINDAVFRVIRLKDNARLFEDQSKILEGIDLEANLEELEKLATEIAEKSLCVVRDYSKELPLKLNKGDKILLVNLKRDAQKARGAYDRELDTIEQELQKRGFETVTFINPGRPDIKAHSDAAVILINCKISSWDYIGGTLRIGWEQLAPFWRGEVLKHPHVIFTSFGDPYKLHDFPYLKNYINAFSYSDATQKAFVRAILGEIPFSGKSPVNLKMK